MSSNDDTGTMMIAVVLFFFLMVGSCDGEDPELADAVVDFDIGHIKLWYGDRYLGPGKSVTLDGEAPIMLRHYFLGSELIGGPDNFVRDWRVAGALMEKKRGGLEALIALGQIDYYPDEVSLPRAIIEACVLALTDRSQEEK